MIQHTLVVGQLQCNCTLIACERTLEAVVIDPGDEAGRILKKIQDAKFNIKYILHTHAHFDHIAATGDVKKQIQAPVCLHADDEMIYNNLPMQGRMFGMQFAPAPPVEKHLKDEEELSFGDYKLQVIHTPGHSPGGVCFRVLGDKEVLFSGDTLFYQSIGRSDLWGGDAAQLIKSIKQRLFVLDGDTPVFPGHGPSTRLGDEKKTNPFLI